MSDKGDHGSKLALEGAPTSCRMSRKVQNRDLVLLDCKAWEGGCEVDKNGSLSRSVVHLTKQFCRSSIFIKMPPAGGRGIAA